MCGRFALITETPNIRQLFELSPKDEGIDFSPNYNVAPTTKVPIAIASKEGRRLTMARWGLVPHWEKDLKSGFKRINARSETVFQKPSFRNIVTKRRCLVPASGFYEWKKEGRGRGATKRPHFIHLKDNSPMVMAGLWTTWKSPEGEVVPSFSVLTCEPNPLVGQLHNRMPVILSPEAFETWLDPALTDQAEIEALLCPLDESLMSFYEVSSYVGSVKNKGPECLVPLSKTAPPPAPEEHALWPGLSVH